jgi:hypothetical protein
MRSALATLVSVLAAQASAQEGPRYRADGPDAELYGQGRGYPMCTGLTYIGDRGCRVGAFSNFGTLFPSLEETWAYHMVSEDNIDIVARKEVKRVASQIKHLLQRGEKAEQCRHLGGMRAGQRERPRPS